MAKTRSQAAIPTGPEIATLRIDILGSKPRVWRMLDVPTSLTLGELHEVIQIAFLWEDEHLWQFEVAGRRYSIAVDGDADGDAIEDPKAMRLRDVVREGPPAFGYVYDFGDYWELNITVSKVMMGQASVLYPMLTGGSQASPPEDSGGIDAYHWWLEARRDPDHPDHDQAARVLGDRQPDDMGRVYIENGLARFARAHPRKVSR